MFGALKQLKFDGLKQHLQALTSGGGADQFEGERLLDEGDYAGAELCLAKALLYSESAVCRTTCVFRFVWSWRCRSAVNSGRTMAVRRSLTS